MLLETDLLDIMLACRNQTLDRLEIEWKDACSCCVVLASGGYPVRYEKGKIILGLNDKEATKFRHIFHAGTAKDDSGRTMTAGGRVLGVTAVENTLDKAIASAYDYAAGITFEGVHFRADIGRR
jgi:phosphoribosylamine--glycine ligase